MSENIIWTKEGTIKEGQREALLSLMVEMVVIVESHEGALNYEWTLSPDGKNLHVYERYLDAEAATVHLETQAMFAVRFMTMVDITRFTVFSNLTPELKEAVAQMNPVYMAPIGGFAK